MAAIPNAYEAYCLDEAAWRFGTAVSSAVQAAAKSTGKKDTQAKQEERADKVLRKMLGLPKPKRKTRPIPSNMVKG